MFCRISAARAAFRAATSSSVSATAAVRSSASASVFRAQLTSAARQRLTTPSLALAVRKPVTTALVRYASTVPGHPEDEPDMLAGVKSDAVRAFFLSFFSFFHINIVPLDRVEEPLPCYSILNQ